MLESGQSWLYYTIYSTVIFLLIYRKRFNLKAFIYLTFTIYTLNLLTFVLFPLPVHASTLEWLREITPYPYIVGPLTDFRVWLATTSTPGLLRFLFKRVVLFLPLGLYLPLIFPKLYSTVKLALAGFLTALGMESTKLIYSLVINYAYKSASFDTAVVHFAGILLGGALFMLARPWLDQRFDLTNLSIRGN